MTGLRVHFARPDPSANLIDLGFTAPPPPPPPPPSRPRAMPKRHHASAPAGERAAPIVAPVPRIHLAQPSVPAAQSPGRDTGSGTGGGGSGEGAGNGGSGAGAGEDAGSDAEWTGGRIGNSDYPSGSAERGAQGTVGTEIAVGADGRVAGCRVTRSSGDADLDATTCRLVTRRFRFRPATDAAGRPMTDTVEYEQEWVLNRR